jgi:hypothetical protein
MRFGEGSPSSEIARRLILRELRKGPLVTTKIKPMFAAFAARSTLEMLSRTVYSKELSKRIGSVFAHHTRQLAGSLAPQQQHYITALATRSFFYTTRPHASSVNYPRISTHKSVLQKFVRPFTSQAKGNRRFSRVGASTVIWGILGANAMVYLLWQVCRVSCFQLFGSVLFLSSFCVV